MSIFTMNMVDIKNIIDDNLAVKNHERKKYSEVFTPYELIEKMLDKLPVEIWTNPNLKWLEPTCGIGNFMFLVYQKLMNGLEYWESDKIKRSNHIITNMLFMVEINDNNVNICKTIFGNNANIVYSNFLDDKSWHDKFCMLSKNKKMVFDIILGNPPFHDEISVDKKFSGGKNKLYEKIIQVSLKYLNDKGYILFLSPDNLFSGNSNAIYKKIIGDKLRYNMKFVSFNKNIMEYFSGIQHHICYFLLKKDIYLDDINYTTIIENSHGNIINIKLQNRCVNPIRDWTTENEELIIKYISDKENNAIYNRGLSIINYNKEYTKDNIYTLIYTPTKKLYTDKLENAKGYGIKKIVLFMISPNLEYECDFDGKYGCGPNTLYIPIDNIEQGNKIELFLKSDTYKKLTKLVMTNRNFLKISFFKYLKIY